MTGYKNRLFDWTQHSITGFIEDQWAERPQGPHCENTKIWPYCLSAAGLSLQLHDKVFSTSTHWVYDQWIDYAKKHFVKRSRRGNIESFAFYYDPIKKISYTMPDKLAGYGTLAPLFYLYPQAPEFGRELYESGIQQLGWNSRKENFVQAIDDPRWLSLVLMLSRELGDVTTERRLSSVAEREFGPNFFGDDPDRFAWQFGLTEPYPRGQLNGLMILSEIGERGAWSRVYNGPYAPQFHLPTVERVDFPSLGISEAHNDEATGQLHVSTYAATSADIGNKTSWRVSQLPDPKSVTVYCDESLFTDWRPIEDKSIEISSTIGTHRFRIVWGSLGKTSAPLDDQESTVTGAARISASSLTSAPAKKYRPATPSSCSCC